MDALREAVRQCLKRTAFERTATPRKCKLLDDIEQLSVYVQALLNHCRECQDYCANSTYVGEEYVPDGQHKCRYRGERAMTKAQTAALRAALKRLSPEQNEMLELRYAQNMTWPAVSARLDRSPGALRSLERRTLNGLWNIVSNTDKKS